MPPIVLSESTDLNMIERLVGITTDVRRNQIEQAGEDAPVDFHALFHECFSRELLTVATDVDVRAWYNDVASISMCERDLLIALTLLPLIRSGNSLEIGAYIGGCTVALRRGSKAGSGKVYTIEVGGAHEHPTIPTTDILADLKKNISRFGVENDGELIESSFYDGVVRAKLLPFLKGDKVNVFLIDANGDFLNTFSLFEQYLSDDAIVIVDDYFSPGAPEKELMTHKAVNDVIKKYKWDAWGTIAGNTWIGGLPGLVSPLTRQPAETFKTRFIDFDDNVDHVSIIVLPDEFAYLSDNVLKNDCRSPLLLFVVFFIRWHRSTRQWLYL